MNKVVLTGRITKDPELKEAGKENSVIRFALAIKDGQVNGEPRTQFITCVAWNTLAEIIAKYVKKGHMLSVVGKLQNNDYEDKDGVMHYQTEVYVTELELLPNGDKEPEAKTSTGKKYSRRG